jgi:hypothetical protein
MVEGFRRKGRTFRSLLACCALALLYGCAIPWLDHSTSRDLEQQLILRSKAGLALARLGDEGSLSLRSFDGSTPRRKVACCDRGSPFRVSFNRIVVIERDGGERYGTLFAMDWRPCCAAQ